MSDGATSFPLPGIPILSGDHAETDDVAADLTALFARLAAGDLDALGALYDHCAEDLHGLALWRLGCAADAADVVQEVFVRLATRGGRLSRVRDPRAYLLTMAHRAAVDRFRRRAREAPLDDLLVPALEASPELGTDARRASRRLAELPPAQREALYLRHFAGLSFAEIGRVTRVPTFTAASRCRLGLERLRHLLGVPS